MLTNITFVGLIEKLLRRRIIRRYSLDTMKHPSMRRPARGVAQLRGSVSAMPPQKNNSRADGRSRVGRRHGPGRNQRVFAALDLGTNNCRLLIAQPARDGFRVIDGFSRIVRLGEGVSVAGTLSEKAIDRTVEALMICAKKMGHRRVSEARCVATQPELNAIYKGSQFSLAPRYGMLQTCAFTCFLYSR